MKHDPEVRRSGGDRASSSGGHGGVVGPTTKITGRITGDGDLRVEGRCEGELTLKGNLHVTAGGVVDAPVTAHDLTVEGGVLGDVTARGAVVLRSAGSIRGAIRCEQVALEDGAKFTGRIEMDVELPQKLSPKKK